MIYGILLAAGSSTRMGQPKQLLSWQGQTLVRHMARQALASKLDGLIVVVGAEAATTRAALAGLDGPLQTVENSSYLAGQATSLRVGLSSLPSVAQAALVLLVDQPFVGPELINRILERYEQNPMLAIVPLYRGQRGNPTLLTRPLFDELKTLEGDVGARTVLQHHADRVDWMEIDDPAVVTDVDTPGEYERAKSEL
jgi:molybdenum cofactor cytidylyltransferase